jgi:hypothetical protein
MALMVMVIVRCGIRRLLIKIKISFESTRAASSCSLFALNNRRNYARNNNLLLFIRINFLCRDSFSRRGTVERSGKKSN